MNPIAQSGLHPDADVLNAFVEHALPEAERVRVMAHMADCAHCREVVFLARAAAEPQSAAAPVLKPAPRPGWLASAFARWRIALIPAAALATVGATILWVQLRPIATNKQMAMQTPPPPGAASQFEATSAPAPQSVQKQPAQSQDALVAPRTASARAASPAKPAAPRPAPAPVPPTQGLLSMSAATPPAPKAPAPQGNAAAPIHLDPRSAERARYAPPAPPLPAIMSSAPALPPTPAAPAVSPDASQIASLSQADTAASSQQMDGLTMMRLAGHVKLPSGLNTVSSAAAVNRMVALDAAGGLFLSQDGGARWTPVTQTWTGKAVEVRAPVFKGARAFLPVRTVPRLQGPESAAASAPAPPAPSASAGNAQTAPATSPPETAKAASKSKAAPPVLAPLFRLVTDRREVWVSADGTVWRRQ
jgi:hypothetical protein